MKKIEFEVKKQYRGQRLDKFIVNQCPEFSRSYIQKLIKQNNVLVNDKLEKSGYRIEKGDYVEVKIILPKKRELKPVSLKLKIFYEDKDVLVLYKPVGVVVYPPFPYYLKDTITDALLAYNNVFKKVERCGIVHRLDKYTSGVIVVAKNNKTREDLISQFKKREVTKKYIALIEGHIKPEEGIIEAPIGRSKKEKTKMHIALENEGKYAKTAYKVLNYLENFTLVEVIPKTGRTHQIRVHFASIGHPIVGDSVYGPKRKKIDINRQFLHAKYLKFKLPNTNKWVKFECRLPQDLQKVLDELAGCKKGNMIK